MNRLFVEDSDEAIRAYPSLSIINDQEGTPILAGMLPIVDVNGRHWDTYKIEIRPGLDYPKFFPIVHECDNAFPKIKDWHVNEDDLSCCFDTPDEQLIKCSEGMTLIDFIRREVIPWFANTTHRRREGYYLHGEYGHGKLGIIEYFVLKLNAPNIYCCVQWMIRVAIGLLPNRHQLCFCGSGKLYRKCHRQTVIYLQKLPPAWLNMRIEEMRKIAEDQRVIIWLQSLTTVPLI